MNHHATLPAMTAHAQPIALRIPDAVRMSGLSRSKLYDEMKANRLRAIKVGGRRLILREDLERYFAERVSDAA